MTTRTMAAIALIIAVILLLILRTREQQQMPSVDAKRLGDLAQYGRSFQEPSGPGLRGPAVTTMPEERREARPPYPDPAGVRDVVQG
jgi:hypothetical protein